MPLRWEAATEKCPVKIIDLGEPGDPRGIVLVEDRTTSGLRGNPKRHSKHVVDPGPDRSNVGIERSEVESDFARLPIGESARSK